MRMRIIWGAKVPKSGVMRMRYKGDSGDMRMRMTLSGYGIYGTILDHFEKITVMARFWYGSIFIWYSPK